jgi:hypothetical protein
MNETLAWLYVIFFMLVTLYLAKCTIDFKCKLSGAETSFLRNW